MEKKKFRKTDEERRKKIHVIIKEKSKDTSLENESIVSNPAIREVIGIS